MGRATGTDFVGAISAVPALVDEDADIAAAQAGNMRARRRVAAAFLHLVWANVERLGVDQENRDDAIAEGAVELLEALDRFDPARNRPFGTYASVCVRSRLQDWLREQAGIMRVGSSRVGKTYEPAPGHDSLDEPCEDSPDSEAHSMHDVLPFVGPLPEDECIRRDLARKAFAACERLTPSRRAAVLRHINGETFEAIGPSRQAAEAAFRRGVADLRATLGA